MFRRGQRLLIFLLTAVYLGQSLFLGALHHHDNHSAQCTHHVHSHPVVAHAAVAHIGHAHTDDQSPCHDHSGHSCTATSERNATSDCSLYSTHSHPRSVSDSHANCAICQYLSQGALSASASPELVTQQVAPLPSVLESTFVSPRPFSFPRPRSPPAFGNLAVG